MAAYRRVYDCVTYGHTANRLASAPSPMLVNWVWDYFALTVLCLDTMGTWAPLYCWVCYAPVYITSCQTEPNCHQLTFQQICHHKCNRNSKKWYKGYKNHHTKNFPPNLSKLLGLFHLKMVKNVMTHEFNETSPPGQQKVAVASSMSNTTCDFLDRKCKIRCKICQNTAR